MSTVEIIKPSDQIVAEANQVIVLGSGVLKVGIKNPGPLAQFELVRMIGAEAAANTTYVMMVMPMMWVVDINGEPVPRPKTPRELNALILQLGQEGISLLSQHFTEIAKQDDGDDGAGDAVKN